MNKRNKNLRARTFFGICSTVLGGSALYAALTNSGTASADSMIIQSPTTFIAVIIAGSFLLVIGAIVLLFVFATK